MTTTLAKIKAENPNEDDWNSLLNYINPKGYYDEDASISFSTILQATCLDFTVWSLKTVEGFDKEVRLIALSFATSVIPFLDSIHSHSTIRSILEGGLDFANGIIGVDDFDNLRIKCNNEIGSVLYENHFVIKAIFATLNSNAAEAAHNAHIFAEKAAWEWNEIDDLYEYNEERIQTKILLKFIGDN
jgi:hypothetical protein